MVQNKTYFGIRVPPFRHDNMGAGQTTIRFVISGKIVSKKNNQMAVSVRRDAKSYLYQTQKEKGYISLEDALHAVNLVYSKVRGNGEYADFVKKFKPVIQAQMREWSERLYDKGLIFPLQNAAMSLKLYFKDRYVTDTVNKQQTIQDLLIECGVIANDDYKTLNPIRSASASFYQELTENLAFISLSFQLPKKRVILELK